MKYILISQMFYDKISSAICDGDIKLFSPDGDLIEHRTVYGPEQSYYDEVIHWMLFDYDLTVMEDKRSQAGFSVLYTFYCLPRE